MKKKLTDKERSLFGVVDRLIRANPFSDERVAVNRHLVGHDRITGEWLEENRVSAMLAAMRRRGASVHAEYEAEDSYLLQSAVLFCAYHQVITAMDDHIREQEQAGDTCCPVPFAERAVDGLAAYGFSRQEATRYLGLFYQLRRAYHFISTGLLGESDCMRALRCSLWDQVFTRNVRLYEQYLWERMEDFSVLFLGATGTGKGAAAAAVGRSGFIPYDERKGCFKQSFTEAFVSTNLSEFTASLVESEVFGHKRGAFTGAVADHHGVLSRCSRYGAVFLDEIGDVPLPVQIKLLRVMQDRTFSPVGSHRKHRFHGRVLAATNQSIDTLLADGRFREDFYYRLCSDRVALPSLRQRIDESADELRLLTGHILARLCGPRGGDLLDQVHTQLMTDLPANYPWHGNVRELEQAVRRVLLRGSYHPGTASSGSEGDGFAALAGAGGFNARELVAAYCAHLHDQLGSYGAVARRTQLDWRTVKKHVQSVERGEDVA